MADEAGTSGAEATTSRGPPWSREYEVFLNFRGSDSRYAFAHPLYNALCRAGVRVFYDDESLEPGKNIGEKMMRTIANSTIYIPIFSTNFASSKWCLRELAEIVKYCARDDKTILPVFYDVDHSDVVLKTNLYTRALEHHRRVSGEDEVKTWEMALRKVSSIKGFETRNHSLTEVTELVVEAVCDKLRTRSKPKKASDSYLFGIEYPLKHITRLLDRDTPDVQFVTIYGIGGVGKTTLARLVFNEISSGFGQRVAFLSDVREKSCIAGGVVNLQKDLISQLLKVNPLNLTDAEQGIDMIKDGLKDKKVLIVLDDIDNRDQLLKLAGKPSWFGMGSRIIITTRDIKTIPKGKGFYKYKMKEMEFDDALKLFSRRVFESDSPPEEYYEISRGAVHESGKLPLTINVIASLFRDKYARKVTIGEVKKEAHKDEAEETTSRTPSSRKFDVFLNFQGLDSRSTVVDVLYDALVHAGVRVFYDDESLRKGEVPGLELKEAIANSTIYIPIFSRNYAYSSWCLRELAEIMKYWNASKGEKTILPIFYDVNPSDVGLKTKVYTTAFQKHKKVSAEDMIEWKMALKEVAKIKGWDIRDHGLHGLAELMVEEVRFKLWTGNDLEKVIDD